MRRERGAAPRRAVDVSAFRGKRNKYPSLPGIGPYDRVLLIDILWPGDEADAATHLAFGAALGQYRVLRYRTPPKNEPGTGDGEIVVRTHAGEAAARAFDAEWALVARAGSSARDDITEAGASLDLNAKYALEPPGPTHRHVARCRWTAERPLSGARA